MVIISFLSFCDIRQLRLELLQVAEHVGLCPAGSELNLMSLGKNISCLLRPLGYTPFYEIIKN